MSLQISNTFKVVKILQPTRAKGLESVEEGDEITVSIQFKKRGADRIYNWKRPLVRIAHNGITYLKEFSTFTKVIENFELERVPVLGHMFNVGDTVRVRNDIAALDALELDIVDEMIDLAGEEFVIEGTDVSNAPDIPAPAYVGYGEFNWTWDERLLELVERAD